MLFEVDFNSNNKWLGQAVMKAVEQHGLMAIEQYGSRKSKLAGSQCLNKWLFYDLHIFLWQPAALCSNAKSCYGRIVLIIVALCLCRLGAIVQAVHRMVHMLANLQHHIHHTAFSDSTLNQGQKDWEQPMAGIGQGNGAGPQIWAAISSPLFDIMRKEGLVAQFICMLSKEHQGHGSHHE